MTEQFTSFSARMAHTVAQKTEVSVGKERYPFSELPIGRSFTRPLDQTNVKSLRARAAQLAKTGKRFIVLVFKDLGTVEVGRLPDAVAEQSSQKAAQDALAAPGYKPPENGAKGLQLMTAVPGYIVNAAEQDAYARKIAAQPPLAFSTVFRDVPETAGKPQPALAAWGAPAQPQPQAPAPAAWMPPAPAAPQAAPTGFSGIPASLLHLTAAEAHEAHVKEQYKRFGVQNYDEMTDDQIAEAQRAIETADAAWEASNVKPTKFPDPSKMAFDAKKTKPTAQAERTPEQIAKYNNRPIPSEEDMASNAAIAEAGRLRWLAQKAEDEKNPLPKSTGWGN